jgi:hypothetical protein
MAQTLHFSLGQKRLHPAFDALDLALAGRGQAVFTQGDGYQAVELPYEGGQLSMLVVLPDAGRSPPSKPG